MSIQAWSRDGVLYEVHDYEPGPASELPRHAHAEYQLGVSFGFPGEYRYRGARHYVPTAALTILHPAIAPDLSGGLAFMPNPEAFSYYDRTSRSDAPTWENRVVAKSLQAYFTYNAVPDAPLVAPTPLLILHGTNDLFLWPEFAVQAYVAAGGDKQLTWIETHNHIELYDQDPFVSEAAERLVGWLDARLRPSSGR
jgi:fermentation-respiration switch protein FrsA (DUF1100 family)